MPNLIAYPAIFTKMTDESFGEYYDVDFPDVPEVATFGSTLPEALHNAWEGLGLALFGEKPLPNVSSLEELQKNNPESFVQLIVVDSQEYAKGVTTIVKKVKKNTSIPEDLAREAEGLGINFSVVLTRALEQEIKRLSEV